MEADVGVKPLLVLSMFPGADLFGMAFEAEGFCVVAGPDVIFGRDIRNFHPPAGRFGRTKRDHVGWQNRPGRTGGSTAPKTRWVRAP